MKVSRILILAFVLTLVSGLYVVKPYTVDAEIIFFGFPLAWLRAARGTWNHTPWGFGLSLWGLGLIVDFAIYVVVSLVVMKVYTKHTDKFHRFVFWLSFAGLMVSCLSVILWILGTYYFQIIRLTYDERMRIWSWIVFLLGATAIAFTWSLIKYRKKISVR